MQYNGKLHDQGGKQLESSIYKDSSDVIADAFIKQAVSQGILSEDPPLLIDIEWKSFKYLYLKRAVLLM